MEKFAKFRGPVYKILRLTMQNRPNFAVYRGLSFVSKLSSILFRYFRHFTGNVKH